MLTRWQKLVTTCSGTFYVNTICGWRLMVHSWTYSPSLKRNVITTLVVSNSFTFLSRIKMYIAKRRGWVHAVKWGCVHVVKWTWNDRHMFLMAALSALYHNTLIGTEVPQRDSINIAQTTRAVHLVSAGAKSSEGAESPNTVTSAFFNTVYLLSKDLKPV